MEPLLPRDPDGRLASLALDLIRGTERLSGMAHPVTRREIVALVRGMNSYYSNLIEGHRTRPKDVVAALQMDFSHEPKHKNLQLLHAAHLAAQSEMENRLAAEPQTNIYAADFVCWIHGAFYKALPAQLRQVEETDGATHPGTPGFLRIKDVAVGHHLPPPASHLNQFLKRFEDFYLRTPKSNLDRIIATTAAHHRFSWIHPFDDGNGRVARLLTQAGFIQSGVDGGGLWSISRGLGRKRQEYYDHLRRADEKRLTDHDGRGYLSEKRLHEFCEFMLETALDQVQFMTGLLQLDTLTERIMAFAAVKEQGRELPRGSGRVLREVFLRGEIPRGDAGFLIGKTSRTAQSVIRVLLEKGLLKSPSPKGVLTIGFPEESLGIYFPNLF
jgi:Fic family protein